MTHLADVTLEDKYAVSEGHVFLTGVQALVRLPMLQRQRDLANGLDTACFISGYRGSPLGGFDRALWNAPQELKKHRIHFQPGVNEDLAATAVWGSQQVNLFDGAKVDGVFGIWYGKGPGVDRSGDAFKHANNAGTSRFGGVLALAGDDHTCKSSTLPHQSEFAFIDANIPVLNPSGVQEILDFGILGFEMSRYSGCWVALKTIAETIDSSATVSVSSNNHRVVIPEDFEFPDGGIHIRWPDQPMDQEQRLHQYKIYAALAFARANNLNRIVLDSKQPRLGIATTGKSYLDVLQALEDLGIDQDEAERVGLRLFKIGMPWPLEKESVREFAEGLQEVLVVEEKRAVIENQLKEQLYNWKPDVRPLVVGKFDEKGEWILPSSGELTPARIARVIASRIAPYYQSDSISQRLQFLDDKERALEKSPVKLNRTPYFCSGCPHNTSTKVPEGSLALAGIGCHYMALWMDRRTATFTQMGGEGASWIGQAPFTDTPHVFVNLGDGTYFHSGILAIRAAVSAKVNVTYKLLVNDAVAMTGGQPVDGILSADRITYQLVGEGVERILVVSDEPQQFSGENSLPPQASLHHRDELPALQLELREQQGVSVIVYVQTCATEKRRRRKRGSLPQPDTRVFINSEICEGCGDCGVQSNCLAIVPKETPLGRKREIDQSACNMDYSCVKGFCPSFVLVKGGKLRSAKKVAKTSIAEVLPEPQLIETGENYGIVITGVGGTGVVTIGAVLGMAAHLDQKGCTVLDMTGLAQKYGAVVSYVKISPQPDEIKAVRVAAGGADLLIGCDSVVASGFDALSKIQQNKTRVLINSHQSTTAEFLSSPDLVFPAEHIKSTIENTAGKENCNFFDATRVAQQQLGNTIGANLLMVGYAWQKGLLPLSKEALMKAIELNAVAIDFNKQAFELGRQLAHNPGSVVMRNKSAVVEAKAPETLAQLVSLYSNRLVEYQDVKYAEKFRSLVNRVHLREQEITESGEELSKQVAKCYYRLLAYKDEYEVARQLSNQAFLNQLSTQFEGDYTIQFQLAPPLFRKLDKATGRPQKRSFGRWIMGLMKLLAGMKFLRGSRLDVFGLQAERRMERRLITEYEDSVDHVVASLTGYNYNSAIAYLGWAESIRGFGPVKEESVLACSVKRDQLRLEFEQNYEQDAA